MTPARSHKVEVEGIGSFTFAFRTPRLQVRIEAETDRMTGGPVTSNALRNTAMALSTLEVLTLEAPAGWDLSSMDPLDDADFGRALTVHRRLQEVEATFRRGAAT